MLENSWVGSLSVASDINQIQTSPSPKDNLLSWVIGKFKSGWKQEFRWCHWESVCFSLSLDCTSSLMDLFPSCLKPYGGPLMVTMQAWGGSPSTGIFRKKKLIQTSLQLIGFFLRPTLRLRVVFENSCPQHGHRCCLPALVPSPLTLNLVPSLARLIHLCDSAFRRLHKVPLHLCLFLCLSFCTCYPQSNQAQSWYSLTQPWPIIVPREVGFSDVPRTCSVSCELDLSGLAAWTQQDEGSVPQSRYSTTHKQKTDTTQPQKTLCEIRIARFLPFSEKSDFWLSYEAQSQLSCVESETLAGS